MPLSDRTIAQLGFGMAVPVLTLTASIVYLRNSVTHADDQNGSQNRGDDILNQTMNPPLVQKNSTFRSYNTKYATYPSIRTFYHPHAHAAKLPADHPLPLLVFVHGLGGSLAQFAPLFGSFVNIAPCLSIELPGHGLSKLEPTSWEAYTTSAFVALLKVVIQQHQAEHGHKEVVLIGHSMGCSLAALLASKTAPEDGRLTSEVLGMVAMCPLSSQLTPRQVRTFRTILSTPDFILDGLRWLDRRGGTESHSVTRFVGKEAGIDLKKVQQRYNQVFTTPAWKRTGYGCLPTYGSDGKPRGGLPGKDVWVGIEVPLLLIAGEADTVTKSVEISRIVAWLKNAASPQINGMPPSNEPTPGPVPLEMPPAATADKDSNGTADKSLADETSYGLQLSTHKTTTRHSSVLQTAILPKPASHALLYDHATYRTVAGLIEDFLSSHVAAQLNLGTQLQQLTTSGKWDVKNLQKWQGVVPVSEPTGHGLFRALKTLREQDAVHTPAVFVRQYASKIYALIDISHDSPIYDPKTLEKGGIQYHKFPTVSKMPPTTQEVEDFIALVERLRKEMREKGLDGPQPDDAGDREEKEKARQAIGVHCHYGYNRTGFFLVCYLIEKESYKVQDAIDEFAEKRAPGIRHDHFIDTLFVRYCVGLRRAPTLPSEASD